MAIILNIETSADICSVCISDSNTLLAIQETDELHAHAAKITILIQECLDAANIEMKAIDAVAVSQGPGSYTGLRVGASTAKGICYALDKPLIAISTLQALAFATQQSVQQEALYVPMIDARRMEVYTAIFNTQNEIVSETEALVLEEDSFSKYFKEGKLLVFSGNGAPKCQPLFESSNTIFSPIVSRASHMVTLAHRAFQQNGFQNLAYFSPFYFKAPNITISKKNIL